MTLWDSGEFLAAIHSLGVPHPPGTPLYIVVAAAWATMLEPWLGFARSVNLLSAVATASGCALLGALLWRWTGSRLGAIAGGIAAGTMFSVWRSANETEVYALAFALALCAVWLGDRAGRSERWRDRVLAVYVLALAVPLHLSALVIAPAVVALAALDAGGRLRVGAAVLLSSAAVLAMALGTLSWPLAAIGAVGLGAGCLRLPDRAPLGRAAVAVALAGVVLLAASGTLVMYFAAQADPFVNQGNPSTWDALLAVVGREQYDVPPLWPRRAPLWLQIGNVIQYADWQVAFSVDQWVGPSLRRTPFTLLFGALSVTGAAWHRRVDRRSFRALALGALSATLGAVLVLNLRAGPSFGIGIVSPDAAHEARERDYFFALGFALLAAWAGLGAARAGQWLAAWTRAPRLTAPAAALLAAAPLLLNWSAASRATGGAPTVAQEFGRTLLGAVPDRGVLFVAGDNDTYPLWYLQEVEDVRRDVTIITIPLLPAPWYRAELERRHGLAASGTPWRGVQDALRTVAQRARDAGRPLAAAVSVETPQREALGVDRWLLRGPVFVSDPSSDAVPIAFTDGAISVQSTNSRYAVDTGFVADDPAARGMRARDGTESYVIALMRCPQQVLAAVRRGSGSVDPRCNLR